ncbi:UPF0184 protein [Aphis craccivora]|uniref:UPF0184 protein n=1 Tax=Aphis craccivora TaxID=307492 RepID=A0A6G0YIA7_APHCR|nr:UPF0184 protein [Aphis craccivora]
MYDQSCSKITEKMADEANVIDLVETTEPSMDSSVEENDDGNTIVLKLHAEIDNLNIVLDHLERKNGDIYSRIEKLLASIQSNKPEEE